MRSWLTQYLGLLRYSIALRLVSLALAATVAVGTVLGALEVWLIYGQEQRSAMRQLDEIQQHFLPQLNQRLWEVNPEGVEAVLNTIAELEHVGRVKLVEEGGQQWLKQAHTHESADNLFATRSYALAYWRGDRQFDLGTLTVDLSNAQILAAAMARALHTGVLLISSLIISALVVLVLIHRSIIRHLLSISRQLASSGDPARSAQEIRLDRPLRHSGQGDELDHVVSAINDSRSQLERELQRRTDSEQALRDYQGNLQRLVEDRTAQVEQQKDQVELAGKVAELGIWQLDVFTQTLAWNERMVIINQLPPNTDLEQIDPADWYRQMPREDAQRIASLLDTLSFGTSVLEANYRVRTDLGGYRYVSMRMKITFDLHGLPVSVLGICLDVTNQTRLEMELRRARDEADAMNAAKSRFLANMSHEIRTPMNGFFGMLTLLKRDQLNPRQRHYVEMAEASAASLSNLINDILDFSKVEAGKLELDARPIDLMATLHSCTALQGLGMEKNEVELSLDVSQLDNRYLIGDETRIRQIVSNLLSNALKFTSAGSVQLIARSGHRHGRRVKVSLQVKDTGIGIAEHQIPRLFKAFEQGSASINSHFGGTGLGLSICQQLCRLMGGDLTVSSKEGRGSVFTATLDLKDNSEAALSQEPDFSGHRMLLLGKTSPAMAALPPLLTARGAQVSVMASEQFFASPCCRPSDTLFINANGYRNHRSSLSALVRSNAVDGIVVLLNRGDDPQLRTNAPAGVVFLEPPFSPINLYPLLLGQQRGQVSAAETPDQQNSGAAPPPLAGVRVLVVDDQEINVEVAKFLLESEGALVDVARDGQEALDWLSQAANPVPHLLLLDRNMPGMNGLECTRHIRAGVAGQRATSLPIVALTAAVLQGDRDECIAAGMNDFLTKPINMDQLRAQVLHWSRGRPMVLAEVAPTATPTPSNVLPWPEPATPQWDMNHALARVGGNRQLLSKMLRLAVDTLPDIVDELQQALEQNDTEMASACVHKLKGVAGQLSVVAVREKAGNLEGELAALSREAGRQATDDLKHSVASFIEQANSFLASSTG